MTVNGGATGGSDTLTGIEFVDHSGGRFVLIDPAGNNGFITLDAAVAAGAGTRPGDAFVFATPPATVDITLNTNDDLDFTIPYDVPTTVTLTGTGSAHVTTGSGADFVVTGDGVDTIHTGGGNDVVDAGGGDDAIVGGQGGGDDVYDGGSGNNTVEYPSAINSITVDLRTIDRSAQLTIDHDDAGPNVDTIGDLLLAANHGYTANQAVGYAEGVDIGTDVLINIQNASGGAGNDTIIGNDNANTSAAPAATTTSAAAPATTPSTTPSATASTPSTAATTPTPWRYREPAGDDTIHVVTKAAAPSPRSRGCRRPMWRATRSTVSATARTATRSTTPPPRRR